MGRERLLPLGLAAVLALAFALRYPGIPFGFPILVHPDEASVAGPATRIARSGDLHPRTFIYPSLLIYLEAGWFAAVEAVRGTEAPPTTLYFAGRLLVVLLSVATVYLCFLLARLVAGPAGALLAAALAAVSLLHTSNSFVISPNAPIALWVTLCAYLSARVCREGPRRRLWIPAALCAGLATGTKYNAVLCLVPLTLALLPGPPARSAILRAAAAGGIAALAFVASTPYALLDGETFLGFLDLQRRAYTEGHPGAESDWLSYGFYAGVLVQQFGPLALLLALLGAVRVARADPRLALVLLSFPLAFFAFMGAYRVHFARQMVPLVPFAAAFAGAGFDAALGTLRRALPPSRTAARRAALVLLAALLTAQLGHQALLSRRHTREITLPHTRYLSKIWIEENLPVEAHIAVEHYTPPLDPRRFRIARLGYFGLIRAGDLDAYDYLVASSGDFGRFLSAPERYPDEARRYREIFSRYALVKDFAPDGRSSTGPWVRVYRTRRPRRGRVQCPAHAALRPPRARGSRLRLRTRLRT